MSARTTVIAEMAWAHDGDLGKALRILRGARQAGADALGIHLTSMPHYMSRHYATGKGKVSAGKEQLDIIEYLTRINPSQEDWLQLAGVARQEGIGLCVMPNDEPSLAFAQARLEPAWYVLSSASFVEEALVNGVAEASRPTLLRVGGATLGEIERTVNAFRARSQARLVLLHGIQTYPTALEETHLRRLGPLREMFGVEVGLADHIDGADPLARTIPMLALACGASVIEKHITWDRGERGEDFESALDPAGFAEMVANLRAAEAALGQEVWGPLSPATLRYREVSRKRTVAARDLARGRVLEAGDLCFKRSDHGVPPDQAPLLVGRRLARDLGRDDPLTWDALA